MDKVFDSVNGSSVYPRDGKPLRCAVKNDSVHVTYWNEAINILNSVKFIDKNGKETVPPCIKNWIFSLKSIKFLWSQLKKEGFKYLILRNINQDPLENFFGCVRSHGYRNINPDCYNFMTSFKTLLINNFASTKSISRNCQEDNCQGLLKNLTSFLNTEHVNTDNFISSLPFNLQNQIPVFNPIQDMTVGFVAGYICSKILKSINQCSTCTQILKSTDKNNNLINIRQYHNVKKQLCHPSSIFSTTLGRILSLFSTSITSICSDQNLRQKLILLCEINIDFGIFKCKEHNLKNIIIDKVVILYLFTWCKNINRILHGIDRHNMHFENEIKRKAFIYYNKHCKKRLRVPIH